MMTCAKRIKSETCNKPLKALACDHRDFVTVSAQVPDRFDERSPSVRRDGLCSTKVERGI